MLQPVTQLFRRVASVYLSFDQDGPIAGRADEGELRGRKPSRKVDVRSIAEQGEHLIR